MTGYAGQAQEFGQLVRSVAGATGGDVRGILERYAGQGHMAVAQSVAAAVFEGAEREAYRRAAEETTAEVRARVLAEVAAAIRAEARRARGGRSGEAVWAYWSGLRRAAEIVDEMPREVRELAAGEGVAAVHRLRDRAKRLGGNVAR